MKRASCDIVISGGGVAGLTAAIAFGVAGFSVVCVDPAPPITNGTDPDADLRTTAFLQPARELLIRIGIWERLADEAMPLQVMRIIDASQTPPVARDFDAADIGDTPFGWNLRNWVLRREMIGHIGAFSNIDFRPGVGFRSMLPRENNTIISFSDDSQIEARLLIGADGRNSPVRRAANISTNTTRFGQKAVAFAVTHSQPHNNTSTEIHQSGGPFTLVPLPDHEGKPCSGVVWMTDGPEAIRLNALPNSEFEAAATNRSANHYGDLRLASRRQVWPIISHTAERMFGPRTALMAEAAHVVPPIGAQGLNMSLNDLAKLRDLAIAAPEQLGDREMLSAYHRARHPDIKLRAAGIALLNRTSQSGLPMLQTLRSKGISLLHDAAPVRKSLMKLGLGLRG